MGQKGRRTWKKGTSKKDDVEEWDVEEDRGRIRVRQGRGSLRKGASRMGTYRGHRGRVHDEGGRMKGTLGKRAG